MDDWAKQHLAKLAAAAPVKRKKAEVFIKVPLWFAKAAVEATNTPKALVWLELLYQHFITGNMTFPMPNGRPKKLGVSRWAKCRALRELEAAGLIMVDRRHRKTPCITIVAL
jgi:hypothetical protein